MSEFAVFVFSISSRTDEIYFSSSDISEANFTVKRFIFSISFSDEPMPLATALDSLSVSKSACFADWSFSSKDEASSSIIIFIASKAFFISSFRPRRLSYSGLFASSARLVSSSRSRAAFSSPGSSSSVADVDDNLSSRTFNEENTFVDDERSL